MAQSVNAASFVKKLDGFSKRFVPKQFAKIYHKVTFELFSMIVFETPVETGRAKANWYPSIGSASSAINTEAFDPSGALSIARIASTVTAARMGQTLWLTNNLPYIDLLEEGSSSQAPSGMVDSSVAAIRSKYRI